MAGGLSRSAGPLRPDLSDTVVIVPARFGSSRLPGKPLADVAGTPLVVRVLNGMKDSGLHTLAVATDDIRIADLVDSAGFTAVMTGPASTGTERVLAAWEVLGCPGSRIVNVQGDEPLVDRRWLQALATVPSSSGRIVTLARSLPASSSGSPNVVKVVASQGGRALYFSRQPVPWGADPLLEHMGIYAYSPDSLRAAVGTGTTALSAAERLEQLAWLEAGLEIIVVECGFKSISVDTPEDLERVVEHFSR